MRLCTLVILGTYMDSDGSNAHVRETTLAAAVGIGERAVREHLAYACDHGYLRRASRGHRLGDGTTTASTYEAIAPDGSTGSPVPVEDGQGRAQPEPGRRLSEPQPEAGRSTTGRSGGLNRNGDAPQPEPGRSPNKEDQVLLQEQTDLSPAEPDDPVVDLVRDAAVVAHGDERELITWIKSKHKPNGMGWWITCETNGSLAHMAKDWQAERDARPQRPDLPEWCGRCGDLGADRNPAESNSKFRYLYDDEGRPGPMCTCHPDHPTRKGPAA